MVIIIYQMPGSNEKSFSEEHTFYRWPAFLDALARILKMTVALIDPHGRLVSVHNDLYPVTYKNYPALRNAYIDFFRRVPQIYGDRGDDGLLFDPLGLPVNLTRLENGYYMVLGGCLDQREPQFLSGLSKKLSAMEVHEQDNNWNRMVVLTPEEMRENLARVAVFYNQLDRYFARPDLPALLSVIDTLEMLIASTFEPERFDFRAILELATSVLVTLAGSGGAFAFSYEYPGRTMTVWSGGYPEILQALAEEWKMLGQVKEPGKIFADLVRDKVKYEFGKSVKGVHRQSNGASIYLGLVGAKGLYLQEALRAMVNKITVALGVSLLSTVFQDSWKMVFNSIRQGIIVTDNKGAILIKNQEAKEFFEKRGLDLLTGKLAKECGLGSQIEEALYSAAKDGCSFRQKRSTIGEGNSVTHLCWDVAPLLRDDGYNAGAVLVFNDITAPIQLQQEIQDWERLATAGEIAASLAHEIRNPLATAKAAIQFVRMVDAPAKKEELLSKLDRELDRMNEILTNFLNITKPQQEEKLEPVNLTHTLHELLFLLNSEAILHEIDLVTNIPDDKPLLVLGSPNSIKQVCLNIARNAIEAMDGGGKLVVSLFSSKNRVHIKFQDTGPGIPAENIATLTKPFFTTKPEGSGLGLAISLAILKMMGGDLRIESSPGEGTTVDLTLPIYTG